MMKGSMKVLFIYLTVVFSSTISAEQYDLNYYIDIFKDKSSDEQKTAAATLQWAGLSDQRLFDQIQKNVQQITNNGIASKDSDYASWMLKALGFSGNEKYREFVSTYQTGAYSSKVRKYSQQAVELIDKHKTLNLIISDNSNVNVKESIVDNRLANMIRSEQYELKRMAAKRIHYDHKYTPYLLDILAQQIKANYQHVEDNKLMIDANAWMLKALAGSRIKVYQPLVREVSDNSNNSKLQRYAKKYLKYFK